MNARDGAEGNFSVPPLIAPATPPRVFVWLNNPPQVDRGPLEALATIWASTVEVLCVEELPSLRRSIGWGQPASSDSTNLTISVFGLANLEKTVADVVRQYPDSIHIIGGFAGAVGSILRQIVELEKVPKLVVYSERPGAYGPPMRRLLKHLWIPIKYRMSARKHRHVVRALLPLGNSGLTAFRRYSWPQDQLFRYMYVPHTQSAALHRERVTTRESGARSLRFLYVGRFSKYTKGTDVLVRAVEQLSPGEGWSLGLVGGYGDIAEEVISWAGRHSNVEYLGQWTPVEVAERMADYDVCIVPSRFDGWNVTVNEAIGAGLGVISTDQAVSHELIEESGAGLVVAADAPAQLARAMKKAIDDPAMTSQWQELARDYRPRINSETVGQYLGEVLLYCFIDQNRARPRPPWVFATADEMEESREWPL